jgi:hypothetical protein
MCCWNRHWTGHEGPWQGKRATYENGKLGDGGGLEAGSGGGVVGGRGGDGVDCKPWLGWASSENLTLLSRAAGLGGAAALLLLSFLFICSAVGFSVFGAAFVFPEQDNVMSSLSTEDDYRKLQSLGRQG